jgi:hypothetical protein
MSEYTVEVISSQKKDELFNKLENKIIFERKANLHGACVKLLTNNESFKEEWQDNFKFMNEDIRPHAVILAVEDGEEFRVFYDPNSKVSIIKNCDYYGWVKSIALATISDFFEDYRSIHRRYSVHGSAIDHMGHAIAIIGPPGTGKTTLTYGLLQNRNFNYISDDWFFTRLFENSNVIYSSEKNSYIRDDIAVVWKVFAEKIRNVNLDKKQRGIVDVNNLFDGRIREFSTLKSVFLLKRDKKDEPFKKLEFDEAIDYMMIENFCNPHQLIKDARKIKIRKKFFEKLFSKIDLYLLNTIETPKKSLYRIKNLVLR